MVNEFVVNATAKDAQPRNHCHTLRVRVWGTPLDWGEPRGVVSGGETMPPEFGVMSLFYIIVR